jgi:DNA modification methylase
MNEFIKYDNGTIQNLNRKFIGIELDDKYFEIADKRIKGEL